VAAQLMHEFKALLNPVQVFDLAKGLCKDFCSFRGGLSKCLLVLGLLGGAIPGLSLFRRVPRTRIVVCGGDGTIAWVLASLDELNQQDRLFSYPATPQSGTQRTSNPSNGGLRRRRNQRAQRVESHKNSTSQQTTFSPPVAIIPLGTGNDIARAMG